MSKKFSTPSDYEAIAVAITDPHSIIPDFINVSLDGSGNSVVMSLREGAIRLSSVEAQKLAEALTQIAQRIQENKS